MTTASSADHLVTGEELLALGDMGPCELIDGRVVPMSPTGGEHGAIESALTVLLGTFVREHRLGWLVGGEVGLYTRRNPDRVRGADLAFLSRQRLPARPGKRFLDVAPDLVVEILSPEDRWQDVRQKIEEYFAIGVERVWIVEPENRAVMIYRSVTESERLTEADALRGEGVLAGFEAPVASLFVD